MVCENQTDSTILCHNGTAKNLQTLWQYKETGAYPPEAIPSPAGTLLPPPGDIKGARGSQIEAVLLGYGYMPTLLLNPQFFNLDAYAKVRKWNKDFILDLLTDERKSTG